MDIDDFIARWRASAASERANYQSFLIELCDLLDVPHPDTTTKIAERDTYVFERAVKNPNSGTTKYIDLYRAGSFVLETKQGVDRQEAPADPRQHALVAGEVPQAPTSTGHGIRGSKTWRRTMDKALTQARAYARHIEAETGTAPPFVIVADIGHQFEIFADFSGRGSNYTLFPNPREARFALEDLRDPDVRERLRTIWLDPHSLDRSKQTAKVSKQIADELAAVARSYREQGAPPEMAARFLMQCIFAMFAEDIGILPKDSFTSLLKRQRDHDDAEITREILEELFTKMDVGGVSASLGQKVLRINGGLFATVEALPVNAVQRACLIRAAERDWTEVEPAIFGTLVEHALDPKARRKYGAHFTPRAYVERLVVPTLIEPLRAEFDAVRASAYQLHADGRDDDAFDLLRTFHDRLCSTRVLDPACGSGNFLYVALEMMKELETEVLDLMATFGEGRDERLGNLVEVDPSQFLGIELNPWAAQVAELVLWIGYLQQRHRAVGAAEWATPVLRDAKNIRHGDALLTHKPRRVRRDADGYPVTRYDGVSTRRHPGTGEDVPDETARLTIYDYPDAVPARWPKADFIIGNPPFLGASRMRDDLGDGYAEAVREAYPKVPESADFVMYWWDKAAQLARGYNAKTNTGLRRFGFITTNSFRQTFNRRVADTYLRDPKRPLSLTFAVPDHPWVDSEDGAAVRIAMTVAEKGRRDGRLLTVVSESKAEDAKTLEREVEFAEATGRIFANLRTGADVGAVVPLKANRGLSSMGVKLHGQGFVLSPAERKNFADTAHLRRYITSGELTKARDKERWVIDLFPLTQPEAEQLLPKLYSHVYDHVRPERLTNNMAWRKENWHLHGGTNQNMRDAIQGLERYIVTPRTAKHRLFLMLADEYLPESEVIVFGLNTFHHLAVLSSTIHESWTLAKCGWMGKGNDPRYNNSVIFDPFPSPTSLPTSAPRSPTSASASTPTASASRRNIPPSP